ncbi:hypothetical protein LCGC14_0790850 [marine sediment metagenome]|uniref:Uncharacterized protein n=1 Tax=marine sediment metagenome TaxID=412755 RepID=A0A0F9SZK7_9ZZZZ
MDEKEIRKDRYGSMVVPATEKPIKATPNTSIPVTPVTAANSPKAVATPPVGGRADINWRQHREATRAEVEKQMDEMTGDPAPAGGGKGGNYTVFERLDKREQS